METVIVGSRRIVIPPEVRAAGDAAVMAFLDEQTNPKPPTTAKPAKGE
ncbi:MAG: hypothetical protein ABR551_14295 [Gemmatimonadales bacterium]